MATVGTAVQVGVPEHQPISGGPSGDTGTNDRELLGLALEHTWKWYEMRSSCILQIVNFYLISIAVLSAGYVSALGANMRQIAGMIGLLGGAATTAAFIAGRRHNQKGQIAKKPLIALQNRLASELNIESLRMVERNDLARRPWFGLGRVVQVVYVLMLVTCLVAAAFGFVGQ